MTMLQQQTLEKLSALRLSAMVREYRRQLESPDVRTLGFEDRFGMMVDAEWLSRQNSRLKKLLKLAALRITTACIEDVDYDPARKLDRAYVNRLADCAWVAEHRHMIISGATGTGKTYLSCAFGNSACRQGWKTKYYRVNRLLTDLAVSHGDGSYNRLMRELKKTDLLILDDFGMTTFDPVAGRDLLEVIEDRSGYRATLIAGQLPVSQWHGLFDDSTVADAVLDRLVHNAYRFEVEGPSQRSPAASRKKKEAASDVIPG